MVIGYWRCPECEGRPKTIAHAGTPPIMICGECATELEFFPTGDTEQTEFDFNTKKLNGEPLPVQIVEQASTANDPRIP